MFLSNFLQTGQNMTGWLWPIILVTLLLLVLIWWFRRRRGGQVEIPPSAPVRFQQAKPLDDLTRIEGIGPRVAKVLNEAGITTFEALARANPAEIQKTLNEAGLQMMNPEGWIEQAALAAKGDWEGFERLQGELKGGRKK
jgi:hypothetical protein